MMPHMSEDGSRRSANTHCRATLPSCALLILVAAAAVALAGCTANSLLEEVRVRVQAAQDTGVGTVATPSFSPAGNSYSSDQVVTINTSTPYATIHYTTDGTTPTADSTVYSDPIPVTGDGTSMTIKAIATKSGMTDSEVASATYTIDYSKVSTPQFSPDPGSYSSAQSVTISTSTPYATIRYTTDGTTTPSETVGIIYTQPVAITTSVTLKAIAYKEGLASSSVTSGDYEITGSGSFTLSGGELGDYSVAFTVAEIGESPSTSWNGYCYVVTGLASSGEITITAESSPAADEYRWHQNDVLLSGESANSVTFPAGTLAIQKHYLTLELARTGDPWRSATIILDVSQ